ncbi:MAG: Transcriptional activator RfaH [Phycisphaerales bacterium]|nr:Transcriptional activator RfaH [Phycisphaerales bacterium]
MLKATDNPPARPPGIASVAELAGDWWVGHTKSRAEKAFAWDLLARDVPHYLPLAVREAVWGGRKRKVWVPLFPGYVFFCGGEGVRYAAMTTNRLCQVIAVPRREAFVEQLAAVERAVDAGLTLEHYPFAVAGRRCRVRSGPLMGLAGTIVRDQDKSRLVLEVAILGQGAALEVAADLLEPLD